MNRALGRVVVTLHVAGLAFSNGCASVSLPLEAGAPLGVYAAVLSRFVAPSAIVESATQSPPTETLSRLPSDLPETLREEFRRVAWSGALPLTAGRELPAGTTTVSTERLAQLSEGSAGFWPAFEREFSGANGLVTLSRIAIDQTRGTALVYFTHSWDFLAGYGSIVLLRWRNGAWHIERVERLWVS